ncbi:hypothetical protein M404DRAFT_38089, partial [Pisolithus tinctorius Marx 270]
FSNQITSFVQPCDAGIICCFKAIYHHNFCAHTVELDEAGTQEIFKIDLLEAMLMAKSAWNAISQDTIKHCWDHREIQ